MSISSVRLRDIASTYLFLGLFYSLSVFMVPFGHALDEGETDALIENLARVIEENYVEQDVAAEVAAQLRAGQWQAQDPALLASQLTNVLQVFDGHFAVRYRPVGSEEDSTAALPVDALAAARRRNFGFRRVEVKRGNVGYIDLRQFAPAELAAATAAAAMGLVNDTHALIIDLRRNGGGDPAMVQLLSSYLLPPRVHLNSLYWRPTNETTQFWTLPAVTGPRMPDKPVYVLIGPRTASAAEEFAYNLRMLERATLIGAATYGAANPGDSFQLGPGWSVFVSTGKAINPISGTNWEGKGVLPHREAAAGDAVSFAHRQALLAVRESLDDELVQKEVRWALAYLQADQRTLAVPTLQALAGQYGDREITLDAGRLWYQRPGRERQALVSVSAAVHYLGDAYGMRIRFDDTAGDRLTEEFVDGFERSFERSD